MRVLIIDDDVGTLDMVKPMLESEGIVVDCFKFMPDISYYEPDLIILDLYMPTKSGIEMCKEIMVDGDLKDIPVVMLSASSDIKDKIRSMDAGAIDYIEKPVTKETLLDSIKKYIHIGKMFKSVNAITGKYNDTGR